MKKLAFISLIFLVVGLSARGQDNPITEFDLYGRWVLELKANGQLPEKLIYTQRTELESILSEKWTDISLLAFEKCEFNSSSKLRIGMCGTQTIQADEYTWAYDPENETIVISTVNTALKNFSETNPEEYAEFGSPKWIEENEFKVVQLTDNKIGIEKTPHNNTSYEKP